MTSSGAWVGSRRITSRPEPRHTVNSSDESIGTLWMPRTGVVLGEDVVVIEEHPHAALNPTGVLWGESRSGWTAFAPAYHRSP